VGITIDLRQSGTNSAGATSIGWSHTVGAGANFLNVGCTTGSATIKSISTVVFGAASLSNTVNAVAATKNDTAPNTNANIWYLKAPTPSTNTITVTPNASCELTGGSESWNGVDQSSTFNAASPQFGFVSSGSNPSLVVTSAVGEQVIDCVSYNEGGAIGTITEGAGQTKAYALDNGAGTSAGSMSDEAGAASVTMSWTIGTPGSIVTGGHVGISIKPAATSAVTTISAHRPAPFKPGSATLRGF